VAAKMIPLVLFALAFFGSVSHSAEKTSKTVTLTTCEWAPVYASTLPKEGFFTEIVRQAFEARGYRLEVTFQGWPQALAQARENTYHGLLGAYYNQARERDFLYSLPIYSVRTIFIARKGLGARYDGQLSNLKGLRVGVSKGYTYTEAFDQADYLTKVEAEGPRQLLEMIIASRVDVIVILSDAAQMLIKEDFREQAKGLTALGPSLTESKLYVAVSRNHKGHVGLIDAFNRGFKALIKSGRLAKILLSLRTLFQPFPFSIIQARLIWVFIQTL